MTAIALTGPQAEALVDVLRDHNDGDPVVVTGQGDGCVVVAFSLATIEVQPSGEVEEN